MAFDEQEAIGDFWLARVRGEYFPPEWFDRLTLDEAYRIQLGHDRAPLRLRRKARSAGRSG